MRDVFILEARLFVVLGESNAWHFSSFCDASFQEGFPDQGFEMWLLESSCYHCSVFETIFIV